MCEFMYVSIYMYFFVNAGLWFSEFVCFMCLYTHIHRKCQKIGAYLAL